ncbi:polysaccharide biosynthesis C-terminal domain-containing protein [Butyrivibrio sp. VCB2006]|uniref:polysaccharide biosynthesis C-terminal domain-containing protein n=1 Tax=Butyrivibrio sp. VCB2006 TaxID=1280679 RepID=UPI00041DA4F4|nr:polysaccharide biosynthesis C-terminal domain-containing protein [Butyrivibrio sp. VCB2006]
MEKKQYLRKNVFFSIIHHIVAVIVGLIVPRLILKQYGSGVNGYIYSITQLLSVITYFDFGVSSVAQAALYKPLVEKDWTLISAMYHAVKKYFQILGIGLFFYVLLLCCYYSVSKTEYSVFFSVSLVLCLAVSMIGQYLFGLTDQVLLSADQKMFICTKIDIVVIIFNGLATYLGIRKGLSIQAVKLVTSLIFLAKPLILHGYVLKRYQLKKCTSNEKYEIPQQWSGLLQHVASMLIISLDTIVLTICSSLQNISVYNVYTFPLNGLRGLVTSVGGGYKSFLGQALVSESNESLSIEFTRFEMLFHFLANLILCVSATMIVPFVKIYTAGVDDAEYTNYPFAYLIVFSYSLLILRIPYTTIIHSAGHFKETQQYCIVEMIINILVSFALTLKLGLVGVTIGTLLAIVYRLIASVIYLRKNILARKISFFMKRVFQDLVIVVIYGIISNRIHVMVDTYMSWAKYASVVTALFLIISFAVYAVSDWTLIATMTDRMKKIKK